MKTPAKVAVISLVCTQLFNLILVWKWQHVGLALAVALGQVVNAGLLFTMLRLHEVYAPQMEWKRFLRRLAIALAVMAGGLWGVQAAFPVDWTALGGGRRALVLAGLMALAVVLYFGTLGALGVRPREFRRREAG